MPKIKTKRGAAKRFKKTAKGKLVHFPAGKSHLLTHKTRKRKRRLRKAKVVSKTMAPTLNRMMPFL